MRKKITTLVLLLLIALSPMNIFAEDNNADENVNVKSGGISVSVNSTLFGNNLKENDTVTFGVRTGLYLDIKMNGTATKNETLNFKVPEGFKYAKTYIDSTKSLSFEGVKIADISFNQGDTNMVVTFLESVEFEVDNFKPEIAITSGSQIYDGIRDNGGVIDINFSVEGYYNPVKIKVAFVVSKERLFEKSSGSYDSSTQSMFYNIKVTTDILSNETETVHYIIDMPQNGLRFKEDTLDLYERTATGTFGDHLYSSTSKNNESFQIYRLFYKTNTTEGSYKAITEDRTFEIEGYIHPLTNETLVSSDTAKLPVDMQLIDLDQPIPSELQNEPYGFLLRLVNNTSSRLIIKYNNEIFNSELAAVANPYPKMTNDASYYAQEIPTCDLENQTCIPIKSEKDNVSSFGSINDGSIIVKVKYGSLAILKIDESSKEVLAGANFTLTDRHGEVAKGKYNEEAILLDSIISKKDKNLPTNNLYIEKEDGQLIPLSDVQIPSGNYTLKETIAPEGYQLEDETLAVIVVTDSQSEYTVTNISDVVEPEEPETPVEPGDPVKPVEPTKPTPTDKSTPNTLPSTGIASHYLSPLTISLGALLLMVAYVIRKKHPVK